MKKDITIPLFVRMKTTRSGSEKRIKIGDFTVSAKMSTPVFVIYLRLSWIMLVTAFKILLKRKVK